MNLWFSLFERLRDFMHIYSIYPKCVGMMTFKRNIEVTVAKIKSIKNILWNSSIITNRVTEFIHTTLKMVT